MANGFNVLKALKSPTNRTASSPDLYTGPGWDNPYDNARREQTYSDAAADEGEQRNVIDLIRRAQQSARLKGFDDPQAEAAYGRSQVEAERANKLKIAEQGGENALMRILVGQQGQNQRQDARLDAQGNMQDERLAAKATPPVPFQLSDRLNRARSPYRGPMTTAPVIGQMLVPGRELAYIAALTDVLRRTGSLDMITNAARQTVQEGKSAEDALAEAATAGVTLDPDEQDALRLFVQQMSRGQ